MKALTSSLPPLIKSHPVSTCTPLAFVRFKESVVGTLPNAIGVFVPGAKMGNGLEEFRVVEFEEESMPETGAPSETLPGLPMFQFKYSTRNVRLATMTRGPNRLIEASTSSSLPYQDSGPA